MRFYGRVGYGHTVDLQNGVHKDFITERSYYGDVVQDTRRFADGTSVNNDVRLGNSISILADSYLNENLHAMRYVEWAGALWTIESMDVQRPRLILRLGVKYNGETPAPS